MDTFITFITVRQAFIFVMGDKKTGTTSNGTAAPSGDNLALKRVMELKEKGNEAYKNGDTEEAIASYTEGIVVLRISYDMDVCLIYNACK